MVVVKIDSQRRLVIYRAGAAQERHVPGVGWTNADNEEWNIPDENITKFQDALNSLAQVIPVE